MEVPATPVSVGSAHGAFALWERVSAPRLPLPVWREDDRSLPTQGYAFRRTISVYFVMWADRPQLWNCLTIAR